RSLSRVSTSRKSRSPTHAPRGLDDARKLSQRDRPTNAAGRVPTPVHTRAPDRVTRVSVVMSLAAVLVGNGVLGKSSTTVRGAARGGRGAARAGGAGRGGPGGDRRSRLRRGDSS